MKPSTLNSYCGLKFGGSILGLGLFWGTVSPNCPKSTLHTRLFADGCLQHFQGLRAKTINWQSGRAGIGSEAEAEGSDEDETFLFGLPPKRSR